MRRTFCVLLLCLASIVIPFPVSAADPTPVSCTWGQVTRVIDGDTVYVEIDGIPYRVRYIGIDTAEAGEPCYEEASAENRSSVDGQVVCLESDVSNTDSYGRLLRYVYVEALLVNAELVRQGYASAMTIPPDIRHAALFQHLEQEAREVGRGCWAVPTPWVVWLPIVMKPLQTQTPTPTCTPTPTRPAPGPANVRIAPGCSQFDAPGNDHYNLNQEYVCFENRGGSPANMSGWHVKDEYGWTYTFPTFTLPTGARAKLHSGSGANTATDLYWGRTRAVWNNRGDTVYLYNSAWVLVDRYSY